MLVQSWKTVLIAALNCDVLFAEFDLLSTGSSSRSHQGISGAASPARGVAPAIGGQDLAEGFAGSNRRS